jgi:Flp pilus assembly pilin Flp
MKSLLKARSLRPLSNERGAEAIEVALWAALVSVISIIAMTAVGFNVNAVYQNVTASLIGAL